MKNFLYNNILKVGRKNIRIVQEVLVWGIHWHMGFVDSVVNSSFREQNPKHTSKNGVMYNLSLFRTLPVEMFPV